MLKKLPNEGIFENSAYLLRNISGIQAFSDANKRTARWITMRYLEENGFIFRVTMEEIYEYMLHVFNDIDEKCFFTVRGGDWPYRTLTDEGMVKKDKAYDKALEIIKKSTRRIDVQDNYK